MAPPRKSGEAKMRSTVIRLGSPVVCAPSGASAAAVRANETRRTRRIDGVAAGEMNCTPELGGLTGGRSDGRTGGRSDGRTVGRSDGRTVGRCHPAGGNVTDEW